MFRKMILMAALLGIGAGTAAQADAGLPVNRPCEVPVAMDFLGALGRLDFDTVGSLLSDDAVFEFPYLGTGVAVRGRADILQYLRQSMGLAIAGIVYRLDQAYPSPEAGALVLEISTQGRTRAGRDYTNRLVGVFVCRQGKVAHFREYFNSAKVD